MMYDLTSVSATKSLVSGASAYPCMVFQRAERMHHIPLEQQATISSVEEKDHRYIPGED
jgi:hypothetical protein